METSVTATPTTEKPANLPIRFRIDTLFLLLFDNIARPPLDLFVYSPDVFGDHSQGEEDQTAEKHDGDEQRSPARHRIAPKLRIPEKVDIQVQDNQNHRKSGKE